MSTTPAFSCPDTFYESFDRKDGDKGSTHYCPGCGHGNVHKYIAEALHEFGVKDRTVLVSPVGCSVFAYYYLDCGNIQVAHGRCPAAATGVKRAHPDAIVLGYQGDGDLAAIGGNEIMQAANRGENITIFFINNAIYGMTGGQMAPTTLVDMRTTTSPRGRHVQNEGFPIKVCELLNGLTAPYYLERVAVGDTKNNTKARKAIRKAIEYQIQNKGFSLVEILSPCPTGWKMQPVDAAAWTISNMTKVFPLGVVRDGHEHDLGHPRYRANTPIESIPQVLDLAGDGGDLLLPDRGRKIEEQRFKISGFGGQGVLLMGVVVAQAGMLAGRHVSWMPSYGPEMRGGTAYTNVTVSDEEIGSPLIQHPTTLVAMNGPSLERFAGDVVPGGTIFYNSSMISERPKRTDVKVVAVPANEVADRLGNPKVANMVMLGAMLAHDIRISKEAIVAALPAAVKSQAKLIELNKKAIDAGIETAKGAPAGA
jgi:2-oxoisovalerate ferredoxin oxidoreductase beta subunit